MDICLIIGLGFIAIIVFVGLAALGLLISGVVGLAGCCYICCKRSGNQPGRVVGEQITGTPVQTTASFQAPPPPYRETPGEQPLSRHLGGTEHHYTSLHPFRDRETPIIQPCLTPQTPTAETTGSDYIIPQHQRNQEDVGSDFITSQSSYVEGRVQSDYLRPEPRVEEQGHYQTIDD